MKNLIMNTYKKGIEKVRIGNVETTFVWTGVRKKPDVYYSYAPHIIPEEGSLNSVINSEESTNAPLEEESTLKSHSASLLHS